MNNTLYILYSNLTKRDRTSFWVIVAIALISAGLELVGVGLIYPFIKLITAPELITENEYASAIYYYFNFQTNTAFFVAIGLGILVLLFIKTGVILFSNYLQFKFTANVDANFSKRFIAAYLRKNYLEYLNDNSSVMTKHLLVDVSNVNLVVQSITKLISDASLCLMLFSLMIFVNTKEVILSAAFICFALYLFLKLTRKKIAKIAVENDVIGRNLYQSTQEILRTLPEIRINQCEDFFMRKFCEKKDILNHHKVVFGVFATLPSSMISLAAFSIIIMILLISIVKFNSINEIIPSMAIVVVCMQRLVPQLNSITTSITTYRKFCPIIPIVLKYVNSSQEVSEAREKKNIDQVQSIIFDNIGFSYPNKAPLFKNFNYQITEKDRLAIVGSSGSGKTTLLNILTGLIEPTAGCIRLNGKAVDTGTLKGCFGYVAQKTVLIDGTIEENIAFGVDEPDYDKIHKLIKICRLDSLVEQCEKGLDTIVGEDGIQISGGQRQRLGIARALYRDPAVIILDEATNSLDAETEKELFENLFNEFDDLIFIVITHHISTLKYCTQVLELNSAKLRVQNNIKTIGVV